MENLRKQTGKTAESLAADYLRKKGFKILVCNFQTKLGEIDILAKDGKTLVIVEVKSKTSDKFGRAVEMVNFKKQNKLRKLTDFLQARFPKRPVRIDVVSVDWQAAGDPKIEHIISAVEEN